MTNTTDLCAALNDMTALGAMPEGSLGRASERLAEAGNHRAEGY